MTLSLSVATSYRWQDFAKTLGAFPPLLGERAGLSRQSAATAEVRASFHPTLTCLPGSW